MTSVEKHLLKNCAPVSTLNVKSQLLDESQFNHQIKCFNSSTNLMMCFCCNNEDTYQTLSYVHSGNSNLQNKINKQ